MNFEFDVAVTQKQYEKNIGNAITDIRRKTDFDKQYEEYDTQVKRWDKHLKLIKDKSDASIFSKEFYNNTMAYVKEIRAMQTTLERTFKQIKDEANLQPPANKDWLQKTAIPHLTKLKQHFTDHNEIRRAQPKLTGFIDELLEMEKKIKEKQNIQHLLDIFKKEYKDEFEYVFTAVSSASVMDEQIQKLKSDFQTQQTTLNIVCKEALKAIDTVKQKTLKNKNEIVFDDELSALRAWMTKIEVNWGVTDKALDALKNAAKRFVNQQKPLELRTVIEMVEVLKNYKEEIERTLKDIKEIQKHVDAANISTTELNDIKALETTITEISEWLNDPKHNGKSELDETERKNALKLREKSALIVTKH
eukprot:200612-Rhodomonas_salina.1